MRASLRILVAALTMTLPGCGGKPTTNDEKAAADTSHISVVNGVKKVAVRGLPKLGTALSTLDNGRLENVTPPLGWETLAASEPVLARFAPTKDATDPPQITFTAENIPGNFTNDVTGENVAAFAKALAAEKKETALVEPVKPMVLGPNAFARYVTAGKHGELDTELQHLVTQYAGRRYTLVLEVWAGEEELLRHRDQAYAVAAGIEFVKPGQVKPPKTE